MGTHATLRIQKSNDYIELHSRWDGFPQEMIENLFNLEEDYTKIIDFIKYNIKDNDGFSILKEWINDFEKLIENYKKNKNIELTTLLFSTRSFSHFSPLPHKAEESLLDYWGKDEPDLALYLENFSFLGEVYDEENDDYITQEIPKVSVIKKDIEDKYKILRIYSSEEEAYLDLKYYNLEDKEVIEKILLLPFFLKEITTVFEHNLNLKNNIIWNSLFRTLTSFYNSKNESSRYYRFGFRNDKELLEDLISSIPFDIFVNQLSIHLMLLFAGKMLPITNAEALSDYKPDIILNLKNDRLSNISFDISNQNLDIQNIKSNLNNFEAQYSKQFKVSPIDVDYIKLNNNFVFFNYETSLLKIFKNIT